MVPKIGMTSFRTLYYIKSYYYLYLSRISLLSKKKENQLNLMTTELTNVLIFFFGFLCGPKNGQGAKGTKNWGHQ